MGTRFRLPLTAERETPRAPERETLHAAGWVARRQALRLVAAGTLLLAGATRWVVSAPLARVHAYYFRSDPSRDATLETAPAVVRVWFSTDVGPGSWIRGRDVGGNQVDADDSQLDPADATRVTVNLLPVGNGTFTVEWQTISAVDGHGASGAFTFTVRG